MRGQPTFRRTFRVAGGDVVIQVNRDDTQVLNIRARPGYVATSVRGEANSIRVSFDASFHSSRVLVLWRDGPYAEVTESV